MLALEIAAFVVSLLFLFFNDLNKVKAPFDEKGKLFDFKKDYWLKNWDDVGLMITGGAIGAIVARELAVPLIQKYTDWPELADATIDITGVVLCTILAGKLLQKLIKGFS